ncbi:MAG: type II toxin-antitoxin system PemK/MazF family toxin [Lentisphaeria bacterium]|nr:type II toxin-antitoxin system PemK/MazF family toxin [Lentisphaeria bacterium]
MHRGEIWWVSLDPTQGAETKKTRPCLVLSQDTLNRLRRTVVVVPLSSAAQAHPPITVPITCQGKSAVAIIDQIRAVAKHRLRTRIEVAGSEDLEAVAKAIAEILQLA